MAKQSETIVTLTDDLDGSKADRTITFGFDGASYEIELSKKNAAALEKALKPYIQAARRTRSGASNGRTRTAKPATRGRSRTDLAQVREWGSANGLEVSGRGRVAQAVQDAYDAAH